MTVLLSFTDEALLDACLYAVPALWFEQITSRLRSKGDKIQSSVFNTLYLFRLTFPNFAVCDFLFLWQTSILAGNQLRDFRKVLLLVKLTSIYTALYLPSHWHEAEVCFLIQLLAKKCFPISLNLELIYLLKQRHHTGTVTCLVSEAFI